MNEPSAGRLSLVDSEMAEAWRVGTELHLNFSAALVLSAAAQQAPEQHWWRGVTLSLTLSQAVPEAALLSLRGRLHEATLLLNGQRLATLPLPWSAQGHISLSLQAGWGDSVLLRASQVSVVLGADARGSPNLAC